VDAAAGLKNIASRRRAAAGIGTGAALAMPLDIPGAAA
jgi:hypothetical protein